MPDQLQPNQQAPNDDSPPAGLDEYISGLQKQDQPPQGLDQFVGGLLASDAREHDAAYRTGQLALSPKEVFVNQLLSQQGKGNMERAWDKITSIPDEVVKSAPGFWQGIKNSVASEWQKSQDYANQPFLKKLTSTDEVAQPYRVAVAGLAGTAKAIPSTIETLYDAARLSPASPLGQAEAILEQVAPNAAQKVEAAENAATSALTHYTNVPVNAAVKASGADTNRLDAKIAEQVVPIAAMGAIPMGEAGALEEGIANASTKLARGVQKGSAYVDRTAAQAMQQPIVNKAVNAGVGAMAGNITGGMLGGHSIVGELLGGFYGWLRGGKASDAAEALLKAKYQDVVDNANAIIGSDAAPWQAVKQPIENQIGKLREEANHFRQGLKPEDLKDLDAVGSDGKPLVQTKNLSGDAKRVRANQDDIADLQDKIDAIDKRAKANQHFDDATRYLTGLGLHSALGAGIGAGFAGATSPPGDTSQMGGSTMVGGVLGLGGGLFGVPKGMQSERATENAKAMNDIGSRVAPQDPMLRPEAQSNVNKLAAVVAPAGYSVKLVTPEEYLQRPEVIRAAQTSPQEAGIVQAPNGHVDAANKEIILNRDAVNAGTGVEWHEFEHVLQQLYGRALREKAPPELTKNFDQAYQDRMSETGSVAHNTEDERDAEVGRILLQNTPIENFWGGKRLFDVLDPGRALSWISSKLLPGYKVDPVLQAPYNRGDVEAMRGQMFKAGEEAAKAPRNAPAESQATSVPTSGQTQPTASTQAPSKPIEQVVSEVDQAARPKVIPAGGVDPQEAVDFLVKMGQTKENAIVKAHAAVQDLKGEGTPITLENIVKKAMQRAIPKPVDVVNEIDQIAKSQALPSQQLSQAQARPISSLVSDKVQVSPQSSTSIISSSQNEPSTSENISQAQSPQNEKSSRTPTETVPQEATEPTPERGVESKVQTPAEPTDHPDYEAIRTEAETAKREELGGTRRKTKEQEISRAGLEAMAQAHAKHVGDDADLVTWRTNKYGKPSISGRKLDPNDPFHAHLLEQAKLSPEDTQKLNFIESNMGKTISADYLHAPEEEEASGVTRKAEQAESGAPERVSGEAAARRLSKSFVPTGFTFNAPSKTFEVNGFSPDKFLNNAQMLIPWAKANGLKAWKDINDPAFPKDFQKLVENHQNNFTAMGKPIEGTPLTRVKPNTDYKPHVLSKDKADLLNAMMGDTSARVTDRKQAPYREAAKADKQILAQQNSPYWEPQTGEVNRIRAKLGDNAKLLESTFETLRPELIDNFRTTPVEDAQTLRPSGFEGDRGAFAEKGLPNSTMVGAGFMPSTKPPNFYSQLERTIESQPDKASPEQLRAAILKGPGVKQAELRETKDQLGTSFDQWLKDNPKATKAQMLDFVRENQVQMKEIEKGDKFNANSKYAIPEVRRAVEQAGGTEGDLLLTLENDGDAYRALMKKFPELRGKEGEMGEGHWAEIVANDVYSGDSKETKFGQYQLPGSIPGSYRETLATLHAKEGSEMPKGFEVFENLEGDGGWSIKFPDGRTLGTWLTRQEAIRSQHNQPGQQTFQSSHWDEPNVVLHLRSNERELTNGGKMLFLEELQSDWGAKLRQEDKQLRERNLDPEEIAKQFPLSSTPQMSFRGNAWKTLGLKIALRKAAESGAKALGWTTGEQQAERYDLSKQVDEIRVHRNSDNTFNVEAFPKGGDSVQNIATGVEQSKLAEMIGKDLTNKISESPNRSLYNFTGVDLKVGGEGMKGFYDKELVNIANDLVKKWGVRVGKTRFEVPEPTNIPPSDADYPDKFEHEVHSLPITDAMRRDILESGQPMFMPATPKQFESVVKEMNLRYDGPSLDGKAHQFTDDKTKSSIDVPADATPEQVKQLFEASRKSFKDLPQFMPSTRKDAIAEAALKFPDGKVFRDSMHIGAFSKAFEYYNEHDPSAWDQMIDQHEGGFVTKTGKFLNRKEAEEHAEKIGQIERSTRVNVDKSKQLESIDFARARKFKGGGVVKVPKIVRPLSRARVSA